MPGWEFFKHKNEFSTKLARPISRYKQTQNDHQEGCKDACCDSCMHCSVSLGDTQGTGGGGGERGDTGS